VVTVRLFAAARAAAGTSEVALPPAPVAELVAALCAGLPPGFARVLAVSSLVWDGTRLDLSGATPIPAGAVIDVLPPFAGG
jgi:molybdopterin converting factor small subunit